MIFLIIAVAVASLLWMRRGIGVGYVAGGAIDLGDGSHGDDQTIGG